MNLLPVIAVTLLVASPDAQDEQRALLRNVKADVAFLERSQEFMNEHNAAWRAFGGCLEGKSAEMYVVCTGFMEQAKAAADRLAAFAASAKVSPNYAVVRAKTMSLARLFSSSTADKILALKGGARALLEAAAAKDAEAVRLKDELNAEIARALERFERARRKNRD